MVAITGWQGGRLNSGLAWTSLFGSEVSTLANGNSVLSSVSVANGGANLDQFMDISLEATISSSAIAAGASIGLWLAWLGEDGTTYGDGLWTTTPASGFPGWFQRLSMPLYASTRTSVIGQNEDPIVIKPGSFSGVLYNNCGFNFTACTVKFRSYNINLANSS